MILRGFLILVAIFSIVIFAPMALDALDAKNDCEDAILAQIKVESDPYATREHKKQSEDKHAKICEAVGMKAKFYSGILDK